MCSAPRRPHRRRHRVSPHVSSPPSPRASLTAAGVVVSLGCLGVASKITLQLVRRYEVHECVYVDISIADMLKSIRPMLHAVVRAPPRLSLTPTSSSPMVAQCVTGCSNRGRLGAELVQLDSRLAGPPAARARPDPRRQAARPEVPPAAAD